MNWFLSPVTEWVGTGRRDGLEHVGGYTPTKAGRHSLNVGNMRVMKDRADMAWEFSATFTAGFLSIKSMEMQVGVIDSVCDIHCVSW